MDDSTFSKILKTLSSVAPSDEFIARSKRTILASAQYAPLPEEAVKHHFMSGMRLGFALSFAALLLVAVVGGFSYVTNRSIASLNERALATEAVNASAEFSLQIGEANYYNESAARVSMALDEISGCKTEGGCIIPVERQ